MTTWCRKTKTRTKRAAPEDIHGQGSGEFSSSKIKRSGILFALAIGIHNFPEGVATFAAGLDSLTLGTSIALAVAVHNIPEGDCRGGASLLRYGQP